MDFYKVDKQLQDLQNLRAEMLSWIKDEMKSRKLTHIKNIRMWTDEALECDENEPYEDLIQRITLMATDRDGYNSISCELNEIDFSGKELLFKGIDVYSSEELDIDYIDLDDLYLICCELRTLFSEYDKGRIANFI